MADDFEELIIRIRTDAKEAADDVRLFTGVIQQAAKETQRSFKDIGNIAAKMFPDDAKAIRSAVKYLETGTKNAQAMAVQAERLAAAFTKINQARSFTSAQSKVGNIYAEYDFLDRVKAEQARFAAGTAPAVDATNKMNQALGQTEVASNEAGKGLWSLSDVARTALGTFAAMAIFFLTKLVGDVIKKVIDSVGQLEQSLIKLTVAEKAISQAGVDIAPNQLASIIKDVSTAYETVSKIDAAKMVSNLAVLTKDLHLSAQSYRDLAMAIPLVAQQAGVTIDSATEQVITGLTKSGRGWADLGITVDAEIIKQRAVADGLVKTREEYEALSAEQKQNIEVQALINILLDNTNANLDVQSSYLNTIEGQTKTANAQWEDFSATLGRISRPTILLFLKELNTALSILNGWLDSNEERWNHWAASVSAATTISGGAVKLMYQIMRGAAVNPVQEAQSILQSGIEAYNQAYILAKDLDDLSGDTPTGESKDSGILDNQEDLQDALEKMNNEILEAQIKLAQDMEEAAIDLGRKLEDIAIEYAKKRADAERDYASEVASINASYQNRLASIASQQAESNQKARNDELERETKFQEQMRQLKEKFLMNLEDALHERDARQVLRLIDQYNLEKAQAEREHALDQENAQREQEERNARFARERADAERERKAKLAEAQRDYQDKLAKLKADEEAERAAAELAYQRKIQDLEREMQDRLEIVAANLVAEFNLTKEGLDAILALYQKYYQEIAQIYAAMNTMLQGQQNLGSGSGSTGERGGRNMGGSGGGQRFAEGGSMVANRPTTVTFGEAGKYELATFTPLETKGNDVGKLFTNLMGSSGAGGEQIGLEVLLSPDLEARVVRNAMGQMSNVVTSVRRSKRQ